MKYHRFSLKFPEILRNFPLTPLVTPCLAVKYPANMGFFAFFLLFLYFLSSAPLGSFRRFFGSGPADIWGAALVHPNSKGPVPPEFNSLLFSPGRGRRKSGGLGNRKYRSRAGSRAIFRLAHVAA